MKPYVLVALGLSGVLAGSGAIFATYNRVETREIGFPGVGMQVTDSLPRLADRAAYNEPAPVIPRPPDGGPLAGQEYQNVKVLGHLSQAQFLRMMTTITTWVAPKAGCGYCHVPEYDENGQIVRNEEGYPQADNNKYWSDGLYTKVVSRRMIQMTQHINESWQSHVGKTGVNCYTCHRGMNVPSYIWFNHAEEGEVTNPETVYASTKGPQNHPNVSSSLASLPGESYEVFLAGDRNIRVQTQEALPNGNRQSIKSGEWTYGLMMHMSSSLGVNCTYCHNSRAFGDWSQSPPTRQTAWYGIRMVRDVNNQFLEPLGPTYPAYRLGPSGDAPKANCSTCHQGAYKPLLGHPAVEEYPSLRKTYPQPPPKAKAAPSSDQANAVGGEGEREGSDAPAEGERPGDDDAQTATNVAPSR
ncbi:MAG: photosynthetic reaction center cytochrome PufC [Myxococcota bacterium]